MEIKFNIIVCANHNSKCSFNPGHKIVCPAGCAGSTVVCNEMRIEEVTYDLRRTK